MQFTLCNGFFAVNLQFHIRILHFYCKFYIYLLDQHFFQNEDTCNKKPDEVKKNDWYFKNKFWFLIRLRNKKSCYILHSVRCRNAELMHCKRLDWDSLMKWKLAAEIGPILARRFVLELGTRGAESSRTSALLTAIWCLRNNVSLSLSLKLFLFDSTLSVVPITRTKICLTSSDSIANILIEFYVAPIQTTNAQFSLVSFIFDRSVSRRSNCIDHLREKGTSS